MSEKWNTLVLRDAIAPNLKVLQVLGYWPPENASSFVIKAYKVYGIVLIGILLPLYMVTEVLYLFFNYNDLEKVIQGSFLFLTHLAEIVKVYHFITKNKRIIRLANTLQNKSFCARNERQYNMLKKKIFEGVSFFYIFMVMGMLTCLLWGIFPLLDSKKNEKIELPLNSYYPFKTEESPVFEVIFIYQVLATAINAAADICIDTTVSSLICVICGELNIMNDTLMNIKLLAVERLEKRGIEVEIWENRNLENHTSISPELEDEMTTIMVECVHQHWLILDVTNEIGNCFNIGVLAQFAAGSIVICASMFQMTLIDLFSIQFVSMLIYQMCMFVEVYLYCWFGNEIILKSENICTSIYSSDWCRNSLAYKKNMLMLMTRSQVPIRLYAGNLFVLSLVTFAAILRSSWSYFAVLRRVHSNGQV